MANLRDEVRAEVAKAVIGHRDAVDLLLVAAIAGGHVLLEGPPGVAKTLLAGAMARTLGVSFARIQFTPDTSPTDITGMTTLRMGEKVFLPGTVFTNVMLADEINRTPPKTQSALLEAMQEHHVTVDGKVHWLPSPFLVVATQNPFEHEGVFPLPESQLDRFLFKVILNYGTVEEDMEMLRLPHRGVRPDMLEDVRPLLGPVELDRLQKEIDSIQISDDVLRYLIAIVRKTRELPGTVLGGSPRAAVHLRSAAKASAWLDSRTHVIPRDVVEMAPHVLRHRLVLETGTATEAVRAAVAATTPPREPVAPF
jgi:MoxR-like ATPase